jgi:hypothetical protein
MKRSKTLRGLAIALFVVGMGIGIGFFLEEPSVNLNNFFSLWEKVKGWGSKPLTYTHLPKGEEIVRDLKWTPPSRQK